MSAPHLERPRTALTCRQLAKILMPLGDQIVFTGTWAVTGLRFKPTGEVSLYGTPADQSVDAAGNPVVKHPNAPAGKFPKGGV